MTGNDCIIIGDDCLAPEAAGAFCERDGGPYDIIVVDGEVVDVICYPPADDGQTTVVDGDGDIAVPQNENNTTVTFDDATNGSPIEGDLVIDGNNVAVYGNGIDETVILGNVVLDGNNVRLRGLTIDGNLSVPKNSLAMLFVKVTGDVLISGNNNVFAGSDVFGDMTVSGNNTVLVQNRIQGAFLKSPAPPKPAPTTPPSPTTTTTASSTPPKSATTSPAAAELRAGRGLPPAPWRPGRVRAYDDGA